MKSHNLNVFFITLIISVVLLLCIVIGVLLYKILKEEATPTSPTPKVRILPDRDNKIILIDGAFHRIDTGLYNNDTYINYPLKCLQYKNNFYNKILDYKWAAKNGKEELRRKLKTGLNNSKNF
jgi:hypothetical protein